MECADTTVAKPYLRVSKTPQFISRDMDSLLFIEHSISRDYAVHIYSISNRTK